MSNNGYDDNNKSSCWQRFKAKKLFRWNLLILLAQAGLIIPPIVLAFFDCSVSSVMLNMLMAGNLTTIMLQLVLVSYTMTRICWNASRFKKIYGRNIFDYPSCTKEKQVAVSVVSDDSKCVPMSQNGKSLPKDAADLVQPTLGSSMGSDRPVNTILIPIYKEPLWVLDKTLATLLSQNISHSMAVFVGFEEKSPDVAEKKKELEQRYANSKFLHFQVTVHPFGIEGDIPGKCSNARWIAKVIEQWATESGLDFSMCLLTSCDVDTLFPLGYYDLLEEQFQQSRTNGTHVYKIWQAPLFFNWGLNRSPIFVRITALFRTALYCGFLIPFGLHAQGIFTSSLKLCVDNDYYCPYYQMDDMAFSLMNMIRTKGKSRMEQIYLPLISAPTNGATYGEEFYEWYLQTRRWSFGSLEMFHYLMVKILKGATHWRCLFTLIIFFYIYGLAYTSLPLSVTLSSIPNEIVCQHKPVYFSNVEGYFATITLICYVVMISVIDLVVVFYCGIPERVPVLTFIFHFIFSIVVVLMHTVAFLIASVEMAIRGRDVCIHRPSNKNNLVRVLEKSGPEQEEQPEI